MIVATSMNFNGDTVPAAAAVTMEKAITVRASGQDIVRQLMAMREAARTAGLAKVVLCLDYAYYEALGAARSNADEGLEAF